MNLYLESGYPDFDRLINLNIPFNFLYGGRGCGKTYGALQYMIEHKIKFIYMRRTQTQCDLINKPEYTPFKKLNSDKGWNIGTKAITKYNSGFYYQEEQNGVLVCTGSPLGYTCALSTISNTRGFDASDVEFLIYDEFIPEKHDRPLKNEHDAFNNAYETINRNRELVGNAPLKVLCLANANNIANALFMGYGLVKKANDMKKKKQEFSIDTQRGFALFDFFKSPISAQKKDTALYKLNGENAFSRMSLNNEFSGEEIGRINSRPLIEYRPIVEVGEITIYQHKSNRTYYVSTHKTGSPPTFGRGETELARFRRIYSWIWDEYMENNIEFEEYLTEILLTKAFG